MGGGVQGWWLILEERIEGVGGLCVCALAHPLQWFGVGRGHVVRDRRLLGDTGSLAPPSSLLRLNPSVLIPKEGDNHRSLFRATIPCGLTMLPWLLLARRNVTV